jgi:X-Pro dipeptidyl-peptidase (S15 family)/X-Pro dipeptidyl-peptidase C-terminal non-catalytic domain
VRRESLIAALAAAIVLAWAPAALADPQPFGRSCAPQNGVRFCAGTTATRVPTFDGIPLDVDVTLPPSGDGPFPTLVMLHGYGGNKGAFESDKPEGNGGSSYHYNNVWFASRGYAVVNYSARGFGNSCGAVASRNDPGCAKGWVHLADQRFEARDSQYLLGLLVDQGIAKPDALGSTGISYGGGQSFELAYLNDRTRMPDDTFVPWKSPNGTPLRLAAAWPRWPWSDLGYSLTPNGRSLDFVTPRDRDSRDPLGVPKQSYISGLYASGAASGFYSPPGADPSADLTTQFAIVNRGEPVGDDQRGVADEIFNHHQGFGLPRSSAGIPPLLIQNGWTDDLFPPIEALRVYNDLRATDPGARVSLQFGDLGHARGQNKKNADIAFNDQGSAFLDQYVAGTGSGAPAAGSVTAYTQTCPKEADAGGPFQAASWPAIHPGAVRQAFPEPQTVTSAGGDPQVASTLDPIAGDGACARVDDKDDPGTANYRIPVTSDFTLLGLPTVRAQIATTGAGGQLVTRLWDIAPDGKQTLVSRSIYRLEDNQSGQVTFQLFGNGYRFERGHVAKLEVLGRDAPFARPSNGQFTVRVSDLALELPTVEKAGSGQVTEPALGQPQKQLKRLRLTVTPRRVRAGRATRFRLKVLGRDCTTCRLKRVNGARVRFGGKSYVVALGMRVVNRRFSKPGLTSARATRSGYRSSTLRVRVMRRR